MRSLLYTLFHPHLYILDICSLRRLPELSYIMSWGILKIISLISIPPHSTPPRLLKGHARDVWRRNGSKKVLLPSKKLSKSGLIEWRFLFYFIFLFFYQSLCEQQGIKKKKNSWRKGSLWCPPLPSLPHPHTPLPFRSRVILNGVLFCRLSHHIQQ